MVLGLLIWTGTDSNLVQMHMLLGLLAVGALWVIGFGQDFSTGGSWVIAACALGVGGTLTFIGMTQTSLMVGAFHWVIQLVHLVLGVLVIGIGHIGAARYRKTATGGNR